MRTCLKPWQSTTVGTGKGPSPPVVMATSARCGPAVLRLAERLVRELRPVEEGGARTDQGASWDPGREQNCGGGITRRRHVPRS